MTDEEIDAAILRVQESNWLIGPNAIKARLQGDGLIVQRSRVRSSLQRVDPLGCAKRKLKQVKRRSYNVQGPNALWHVDGNHKLIRYVF
jgi:hypothetical protein